jgi:hypothetical protein
MQHSLFYRTRLPITLPLVTASFRFPAVSQGGENLQSSLPIFGQIAEFFNM